MERLAAGLCLGRVDRCDTGAGKGMNIKVTYWTVAIAIVAFGILVCKTCNRVAYSLGRLNEIDAQKSMTIHGGPSTGTGNVGNIDWKKEREATNYWQTNYVPPMTNFITFASNRVHIEFGEGYHKISLYKFTDDEWNLITNYWQEYIVTNSLPMSYGGPIDHAPK